MSRPTVASNPAGVRLAGVTAALLGILAATPAAAQQETAWRMSGVLFEVPYGEDIGCGFEGIGAQLQARLTRGGALRYGIGAGLRAAGVFSCSGDDIGIIDGASARAVERDDDFALRPVLAGVVSYPINSSRIMVEPGVRVAAAGGWLGDDLVIVPEAALELLFGANALAMTASAGRMHAPVRYIDLSDGRRSDTERIWRTMLELGLQIRL